MDYRSVLANRTHRSGLLLNDILEAMSCWTYDPLDRKCRISIQLCSVGEMELQTLSLLVLRATMTTLHGIHPDCELRFERKRDRSLILINRGAICRA